MATSVAVPGTGASGSAGADLMGSVPADLFSSVDASTLEAEVPQGDGIETVETAVDPEVVDETPIGDVPEEAQPPQQEEEKPYEEAAAPADELPEGVKRGKDANGKEGMFLTPPRYKQFHEAYRAVTDFSNAIGEPLTPAALDLRQRAFMGQERLYSDLTSGDPATQGKVLQHFFKEARDAQQMGLVGTNPIVPLAQEFYKQVKTDPEAYAHLRMEAARDLISEMYAEAGTSQNLNVWRSVGHIAKALGLSFKPEAEMQNFANQQSDPLNQANSRIQELQAQLDGRRATDSTAQYQSWQANASQENAKALVEEALLPSISPEQRAAWEKFPTQFQNLVVAPLNKAVRDVMARDVGFQERIELLGKQAQRASSAQARAAIANDMKQLFVNRARIAADALNKPILKEAGSLLQQQNQQTHQRRQAAQEQRTPQGTRAAVPHSLVPDSVVNNRAGTQFNVNEAMRDMAHLFGKA